MSLLRRIIRKIILEAFTKQDVLDRVAADDRDYGRGKFGANAKDMFRQQREEDPKIDQFLNKVITIHWKPVKTAGFSPELDDDLILEPLKNTSTKDELSCTPYLPDSNGYPQEIDTRGWYLTRDYTMLGIQIKGYISWLEHGDAQSGHGHQRDRNPSSGANKQPRRTRMGRDPGKGNLMRDVIQSIEDFESDDILSTYGDGEALVDNWVVEKIWYQDEDDQVEAYQAASMLSKRFGKQIPFQMIGEVTEQLSWKDFIGSYEGWEPEREWRP